MILTTFGRCLDPLLMLLYPHPVVNKQAVFTKLSEGP